MAKLEVFLILSDKVEAKSVFELLMSCLSSDKIKLEVFFENFE